MGLLKEAYEKALLNEEFGEDGTLYLYHGTDKNAVSGIQQKGFEREFTASNGGNMYGAGVYTTFTLSREGQNMHGSYGNMMLKMRFVGDLNKYIIYYQDYARRIHGTDSVPLQMRKILGDELYSKFERTTKHLGTFDKMMNTRNDKVITSKSCYDLIKGYLQYNPEADYKIDGFIFHGGHDGYVCFCKNFKDLLPIEVSTDMGKTWKPIRKGRSFDKFATNDVDLRWELGKVGITPQDYKYVPFYFTNGYARITNRNDKYNFVWKPTFRENGFISDVWFDDVPLTFTDRGTAVVVYEGEKYVIKNNNGSFEVYSPQGVRLCYLDDLPMYVKEMGDDFDDSDEF